jgi:type IV pilus assembly protein PilE
MSRAIYRAGFTLMELIAALAIVAILATLAFPGFQEALMRGRRGDAVASLLAVQLAQEKWRANHPAYADLDALGWADAASLDGHYLLRLSERSAAGYRVTAAPRPDGPQRDDACGTFALNERGPVITPGYADAACWRR